MLGRCRRPCTKPSVHRPPCQRLHAPPTAPSGPGAPQAPVGPTKPQGWAEGAHREHGPHSNRLFGTGSGLKGLIQSAGTVSPAPNAGSHAGPPPTQRKPRDTLPQHSTQGFCFGGDENNDP